MSKAELYSMVKYSNQETTCIASFHYENEKITENEIKNGIKNFIRKNCEGFYVEFFIKKGAQVMFHYKHEGIYSSKTNKN